MAELGLDLRTGGLVPWTPLNCLPYSQIHWYPRQTAQNNHLLNSYFLHSLEIIFFYASESLLKGKIIIWERLDYYCSPFFNEIRLQALCHVDFLRPPLLSGYSGLTNWWLDLDKWISFIKQKGTQVALCQFLAADLRGIRYSHFLSWPPETCPARNVSQFSSAPQLATEGDMWTPRPDLQPRAKPRLTRPRSAELQMTHESMNEKYKYLLHKLLRFGKVVCHIVLL